MKLVSSFLLVTGAAAVSEVVKVGKTSNNLVPNMAKLRRDYAHANRMLGLNAQCKADTEALYNSNPQLVGAFSAWKAEFDEKTACDPDPDKVCAFDSTTLQSHQAVEEACRNAGGQVFHTDVDLRCQFNFGGQIASLTIDIENIPDCLATSCDATNVSELAGVVGDGFEQSYEAKYVEQCTANAVIDVGSTSGGTSTTGNANSSAYRVSGAVSAVVIALVPFAV